MDPRGRNGTIAEIIQCMRLGRDSMSFWRGRPTETAAGVDPGQSRRTSSAAMVALIGIDCATQPNKVGLALGELDGERVRIKACRTGSPKESPASIVSSWLKSGESALLALDAPLGWPLAIG